MSSAEIVVALAVILVAAILLLDLPIKAWSKTRFVLVAFVVVALTITMTARPAWSWTPARCRSGR